MDDIADPIDELTAEHRLLERILDALDHRIGDLGDGSSSAQRELLQFAEVLLAFHDRVHQPVEEQLLFAAMEEYGIDPRAGLMAAVAAEHRDENMMLRELAYVVRTPLPWSDQERARIAEIATTYSDHVRGHLETEDSLVYPMARTRLPPHVLATLARRAAELRARSSSGTNCEALSEAIARLTQGRGVVVDCQSSCST